MGLVIRLVRSVNIARRRISRTPRHLIVCAALLGGLGVGLGCSKPDRVHKAAGNLYLRKGDLVAAQKEFSAAIALAPKDADSHTLLGDVLFEKGDLTGASKAYQTALSIDARAVEAHRGLGTILVREKKLPEASQHFEALTAANKADYRAWRSLGMIAYEQKKFDDAIAYFITSLRNAAGDPASLYHLGLSLINKGDAESLGRARQVVVELERATPEKPFAPYLRALLLAKQGNAAPGAVAAAVQAALAAGLPKPAVDETLRSVPEVRVLLEHTGPNENQGDALEPEAAPPQGKKSEGTRSAKDPGAQLTPPRRPMAMAMAQAHAHAQAQAKQRPGAAAGVTKAGSQAAVASITYRATYASAIRVANGAANGHVPSGEG